MLITLQSDQLRNGSSLAGISTALALLRHFVSPADVCYLQTYEIRPGRIACAMRVGRQVNDLFSCTLHDRDVAVDVKRSQRCPSDYLIQLQGLCRVHRHRHAPVKLSTALSGRRYRKANRTRRNRVSWRVINRKLADVHLAQFHLCAAINSSS